ncbi:MAG: lactate utilization protein [Eubacteriales bacterium]|nr:lactate utilization protein [Eubacteriales bacterium]
MDYSNIQHALEAHGFMVSTFRDHVQATAYLTQCLSGRTIGFGGSVTVRQMGLYEALSAHNVTVWHHEIAGDEVKHLAAQCSIYITSVNAISETGEIVCIDGAGNRLAMMLYGPEKVYYVVGRNKIVSTRDAALLRAQQISGPLNARRMGTKTPCAVGETPKCYNCSGKERICCCTLILDRAPNHTPSEVILVDEDLGF